MTVFEPMDRSIGAEKITYQVLLVDLDEATGIATITFNRPDKRNAMNPRFHHEMTDVLDRFQYDPRVRVLVLTGAGSAFCAGMDLSEFFADNYEKPGEFDRLYWECCDWRGRTLRNYPKPTIAMINGFCFGAAFSTVEACDLAIAADTAKFGLSEINFGIFPGGPVSKTMANVMHPRQALYYAMTGRPFDAKRAEEVGMINYSVPLDKLRDDVMALAAELAQKEPEAIRATKEAFRYSLDMDQDAATHYAFIRQQALTYRQNGAWLNTGVKDFKAGTFKPGLESHPGLGKR